ncbi:ribose-phosphate diphosphokinase [Aquisalimonas sp.]|uniref:ribose-phosphate diphosphokinase n=1 Tax=unclassified Aquisalimonas TaxID=2644645 RepID=UPI0025B991E7|nr:ribose-phosphate diphosphokinase [Aquisalimonas sp.]
MEHNADADTPQVFVLARDDAGWRSALADNAGVEFAPCEERVFEDGEYKLRPLVSVRDRDVYVVHSLAGDAQLTVNDKLARLLFFIATVRDQGARRVTAVAPYLPYARKDRRTKPRDPLTFRYLAQLFEAMGTDRLVTLEAHNIAALENAFRCATTHLSSALLLADAACNAAGNRPLAVVSPDAGGAKRADHWRDILAERTGEDVGMVFLEKRRSEGVVSGDAVVGDVNGRVAVIVDDMIVSGGTMARAVDACRARGATGVIVCAAHGLFSAGSDALLDHPGLDALIITSSVPVAPRVAEREHVRVVAVEPVFVAEIAEPAG